MPRFLQHIPRIERRAAVLSFAVGITLLAVKFLAYFITGSAAIFSDALESIVNVMAAGFALYALAIAHLPADREHPYGHGKIEFLSAGFEGGMILLAAGVIVLEAVRTLIVGATVSHRGLLLGMLLMAVVMVVHALLGLHLIRTGRKNHSLTLEADGQHLLSDAATSAVALAALFVVKWTGWKAADPVGAMLVAAYITVTGIRLVRRSTAGLMDEQDLADAKLLRGILDRHTEPGGAEPRICSYHKLRHRHSGRYHWVDFHVVIPAHWDIARGHEIASKIEFEIEQALGEGDATAHVEPCILKECPLCRTVESAPQSDAQTVQALAAKAHNP